jgi:hypothetical protein
MKRFITNDDLTVLVTKASMLRKLAKAAQKIHADNMKAADECIGRGHALLRKRKLTPTQRAKIEQQLERDQQFFECAQLEYGKKSPGYSAVVAEMEGVLRELAAIYVGEGH